MNANELRRGNLVDTVNRSGTVHLPSNRPMKVYDIAPFGVSLYPPDKNPAIMAHVPTLDIKDICPIRITEEVLLKCGFAKSLNGDKYFWNHHGFHCEFDGEDWAVLPLAKGDLIIAYINHLHQLQNLYYALIGKELTYAP